MSSSNPSPVTKTDLIQARRELSDELAQVRSTMATKHDLKCAVDELNGKISRVAMAVVRTQADVSEIKSTMATSMSTKNDINRVLTAIDSIAGKTQDNNRAAIIHGQALTEDRVQLQNHERRIKSIETRLAR